MLEIVTQALRFLKDVLLWWIKTVGGPLVAVVQLVYPLKYQTWPPGMTWVLFGLSWIFATFLAWREQYRRAKGKDSRLILTTIIDEYNRVKPPGELDLDLAALFVRHCDDFTDERQLNAVCADLPGSYPGPFELIELKYGPKALAGKRLKLLRDARISQFRIWNDRDLDNYIEASWSVENKLPEPDETAAMKVAIRRARGSW